MLFVYWKVVTEVTNRISTLYRTKSSQRQSCSDWDCGYKTVILHNHHLRTRRYAWRIIDIIFIASFGVAKSCETLIEGCKIYSIQRCTKQTVSERRGACCIIMTDWSRLSSTSLILASSNPLQFVCRYPDKRIRDSNLSTWDLLLAFRGVVFFVLLQL